eukprot:snap_masked-scaffold_36-processed-gene-2.42-mRNA-1 protein AED:1.00 eAED:1.00 QI:0/0/0/0/1/1/2/0/197
MNLQTQKKTNSFSNVRCLMLLEGENVEDIEETEEVIEFTTNKKSSLIEKTIMRPIPPTRKNSKLDNPILEKEEDLLRDRKIAKLEFLRMVREDVLMSLKELNTGKYKTTFESITIPMQNSKPKLHCKNSLCTLNYLCPESSEVSIEFFQNDESIPQIEEMIDVYTKTEKEKIRELGIIHRTEERFCFSFLTTTCFFQ